MLGIAVGDSEAEGFWRQFLGNFKERGLNGTRLVISDAHQGLLALIEKPEAMEGYLIRAQSQNDAKRRAHRCVEAVQEAGRLLNARGWLRAMSLPP